MIPVFSLRTTLLVTLLLAISAGAAPQITEEQCLKYQGLKGAVPRAQLEAELGPPTAVLNSDADAEACSEKYRAVLLHFPAQPHLLYVTPKQIFRFLQDSDGKCQYGGSVPVMSEAAFSKLRQDGEKRAANKDKHPWATNPPIRRGVNNGKATATIGKGSPDPYLSKWDQYFADRRERKDYSKPSDADLQQLFGTPPFQTLNPHARMTGPAGQLQDYLLNSPGGLAEAQKAQVYRHPTLANVIYIVFFGTRNTWGYPLNAPPGY